MIGKQVRNFKQDEAIFHEGDAGDCAYLIETGRVLVYLMKDNLEIPLKILGKGDIFGEMSMIDNSLRSASCRALSELRLCVVTQEQLLDRIQNADPVVRLLMRALLDRLRVQNDGIRGRTITPNKITSEVVETEKREALDRIRLENKIAAGLESSEFIPHYQPIYDLDNQQIKGCEALIRWSMPDGSIVSPGKFIDVLEQSSLILDVGQMMIQKCLAHLSQVLSSHPVGNDFYVSINVSGRQFADPQFLKSLERERNLHGLPAHHIKLEVTERIMTEGPLAIATLQNCRSLGYKIAIDDFGTGFSSLQYLASMPLNDLKVDRSFVSQMMTNEKSMSIVQTLTFMAGLLNLTLIAEGIETKEQLQQLRKLGVRMGQGFLFCKPLSFPDFVQLLGGAAKTEKKAA